VAGLAGKQIDLFFAARLTQKGVLGGKGLTVQKPIRGRGGELFSLKVLNRLEGGKTYPCILRAGKRGATINGRGR